MAASRPCTAGSSASSSPSPTSSSSPVTCPRSPTASARGPRPSGSSTRPPRRQPSRWRSAVRLASPWCLALLALVALVLPFFLPRTRRASRRAAVRFPTLATLRAVAPGGAAHRRAILGVLRVVALVLLVLALARPQAGSATTKLHREGVDAMLALDLSGSMLAEGFTLASARASPVDAVKAVVKDF